MLTSKEQKLQQKIYKQLLSKKKELVNKYGKDAEKIAYGRSVSMAKNNTLKLDNSLKNKIVNIINEKSLKLKQ
jgi:hypothetical protein